MNFTRLLAGAALLVLVLRALPLIFVLLGSRARRSVRKLAVAVDVAGGVIMLLIVVSVLWRGEVLGALLLALIGVPVFVGATRAFPAWWRGDF